MMGRSILRALLAGSIATALAAAPAHAQFGALKKLKQKVNKATGSAPADSSGGQPAEGDRAARDRAFRNPTPITSAVLDRFVSAYRAGLAVRQQEMAKPQYANVKAYFDYVKAQNKCKDDQTAAQARFKDVVMRMNAAADHQDSKGALQWQDSMQTVMKRMQDEQRQCNAMQKPATDQQFFTALAAIDEHQDDAAASAGNFARFDWAALQERVAAYVIAKPAEPSRSGYSAAEAAALNARMTELSRLLAGEFTAAGDHLTSYN